MTEPTSNPETRPAPPDRHRRPGRFEPLARLRGRRVRPDTSDDDVVVVVVGATVGAPGSPAHGRTVAQPSWARPAADPWSDRTAGDTLAARDALGLSRRAAPTPDAGADRRTGDSASRTAQPLPAWADVLPAWVRPVRAEGAEPDWAGIETEPGWAGIETEPGWAGIETEPGWAGIEGEPGWLGHGVAPRTARRPAPGRGLDGGLRDGLRDAGHAELRDSAHDTPGVLAGIRVPPHDVPVVTLPAPRGAVDLGRPVGGARGTGPWARLRLSDGRTLALTGSALVGRDPAPRIGESPGTLVAVDDPGRSVSKTHLGVGVDADGAWVVDRQSTNGTVVTLRDGQQILCVPERRVRLAPGATVSFGDHAFTLSAVRTATSTGQDDQEQEHP